jgi:hypothetical protein
MTSSPYAAPHSGSLLALTLALLSALGCSEDTPLGDNPDGSFGTGAGNYPRDAGMDGAATGMDAAASSSGPTVNVRFLHAIPNTGPLLVCHDPDGPGPSAARALGEARLRAEFGTRSAVLRLPALTDGVLSLHRARALDAGIDDAGSPDGGVDDPCAEVTREATIPLPIRGTWLAPRDPLSEEDFADLDLLSTFESDAPAITLLGTGVALRASAVDQRAATARAEAASEGEQAAAAAEALERATLAAAFGARALIQPDPRADQADTFSLSVLHAVADVPPATTVSLNSAVGALRVCMTAGSLDDGARPRPPSPGIPFRVRSWLGSDFEPRLTYEFRAYAQADFDARQQDCATTSLSPVARASFDDFVGGRAYTLAILGALDPSALCRTDRASLVRPSCSPYPSELGARIEIFED